jgi:hypothetical protein
MTKDAYQNSSSRHDWNFGNAIDCRFSTTATDLQSAARRGTNPAFYDAAFYGAVQSRTFPVPTDEFAVPAKTFPCFDGSGNLAARD